MDSESYEYRDALPHAPAKGRAAALNPGNRFETVRLHVLGEFLDEAAAQADNRSGPLASPQVNTTVYRDDTRTILNRVTSPDLPVGWTLNPYRGCEHGCIYCFARCFHEFLGFSCGLDFETKIAAKMDAAELLRGELGRPGWRPEPITMALATDCYQPIEGRLRLARACLEVLADCRQPVCITTKSRRVLRDLDLLRELARFGAVQVQISVTTLDARLAGKLEPRASSPAERLKTIRALADAGIPVGVLNSPVIPALTDREMPAILRAAAEAGAGTAGLQIVRLPGQVQALFADWLGRHYPDRTKHVDTLTRQAHGGELDAAGFFDRFEVHGPVAQQIERVFAAFAKRYHLDGHLPPLSGAHFRRPAKGGQMRLFE